VFRAKAKNQQLADSIRCDTAFTANEQKITPK